jgi:hypothetical protein
MLGRPCKAADAATMHQQLAVQLRMIVDYNLCFRCAVVISLHRPPMSDLPKPTSSPPPAAQSSTSSSPPPAASTTTTISSPTDTGKSTNPFENDAVVVPREGTPSKNDAPSVNISTKPTSPPPSAQIEETPVLNAPAHNAPTNPAVAELKAIFPDYDEIILCVGFAANCLS